ncbi:RagB/SusD family nutrient uptake outer membrane protein [Pseudozobellia thermophila]|uniref:Starch-binding associating with outer membrane n=1 Tax=Pseudozobellia thermophila TaxID=192903 RepID=A0A1M6G3H3_9FLAO|nr:RagB/SusD family nutrient uptake outer membrane protein [Pseudozobellia thermophila]SHJ04464.1 Starch-binding associating with outer membrane [Pseudozobellia thermophila]
MKNIKLNSRTTYLAMLLSAVFLGGCEDYLEQLPQDSLSEAVYFETPEQFTNAANHFYTRLGFDYGDESSDLSGNISGDPLYGQGNTITPTTDDIWEDNYSYLRAPNQLIEKAAAYTGDPSEIAEPVATAYFFRAWHHFALLKRFGGVPLATQAFSLDSEEEIMKFYGPRNSRYEVIDQIIKDLDMAIADLPSQNELGDDKQGKVTLEAAKSFKARVLLYEATWEKYVGTATDGDGTNSGAGSNKPSGYPSVTEMLAEAKKSAKEVMDSGAFELWDHRDAIGEEHLFYLFNLEDAASNPAGLTKADNKEFIFQTVYDFTLRKINQNLTHAKPVCPSRKLMDMYLCSDGLPVQHSKVFKGYDTMTSEFENRDYRLKSFVNIPLKQYWGWGSNTNGGGAQYGVAFEDSGIDYDYRYVPQLTSPGGARNVGYQGRKFTTEHKLRETREESYNYPQIRLAEVLLIYAEATCELNDGAISDSDLDISINKIRERSGVAPLTNALIAPYPDLNMLGEIRRERAIELNGENFRFDDLKRWNIAIETLNKDVCLTYIEGTEYETAENPKDPGNPIYVADAFPYGLTQTEKSTSTYSGIATTKAGALILDPSGNRNWTIKNYVDPIPTNQIELNPALVQNPGW